jgi:hypothetical protein|eukprot:g5229.t1
MVNTKRRLLVRTKRLVLGLAVNCCMFVASGVRLVPNDQPLLKNIEGQFYSFVEINSGIAPATLNTREDPDGMRLPLKSYNCACSMTKARLEPAPLNSFFEEFEFVEAYEENENGEMAKVEQKEPEPGSDILDAKPDFLECNCHHKPVHIQTQLAKQP